MAFDPLNCLGAVFLFGTTHRRDDNDNGNNPSFWVRTFGGIITAIVVALVSGVASGFLASYVVLAEHSVKIKTIEERQVEDRKTQVEDRKAMREEFKDVSLRLRELERRK